MIVELLGVPGSGKTYFVNQLLKKNSNIELPLNDYLYNNSRIKQNLNKLFLVAQFFFFNEKLFRKFIRFFRNLDFNNKIKGLKMFVYLISTIQVIEIIRKANDEKLYVIDEGICQVIWGICYNLDITRKAEMKIILNLLEEYLSDEIIYIEVEDNIIKERLLQRTVKGGSELQHDIVKNADSLEKAKTIMTNLYEILREKNQSNVKYMNGGVANESNSNHVSNK